MNTRQVMYQRAAYTVITLLILLLGFVGYDPYSRMPPIGRVGVFIVVVFLLAGIVPRSFLARAITSATQKEVVRRSTVLPILGLAAPVGSITLSAIAVIDGYSTLRLLDTTNLTTIDRGLVMFDITRYWTIGVASVALLVFVLGPLLSKRSREE